MSDYFLWNTSSEIFSTGSFHLQWYAILIILAFILSIYFLKELTLKEKDLNQKTQPLVLVALVTGLVFSRWGALLFYHQKTMAGDVISAFLPFTLKPSPGFIGIHSLSLPAGILGIITGTWIFSRFIAKDSRFRFILDRVAVVSCLAGGILFFSDFFSSGYLGLPTDSADGIVFARPVTDGLKKLNCCIMRNPDGPNPLIDIQVKKTDNKLSREVGSRNISFTLTFKPEMEEREATEFIIGDVKTFLFEHPLYVRESGSEPIKYALSKSAKGNIQATITTLGIARHPVQLMLAFACMVLFAFSYVAVRKQSNTNKYGVAAGLITVLFSLFYFIISFILDDRQPVTRTYGLQNNQWLILVVSVIGLAFIFIQRPKSSSIAKS
jgi:prolipoprotein diacylglyceryltransferase